MARKRKAQAAVVLANLDEVLPTLFRYVFSKMRFVLRAFGGGI